LLGEHNLQNICAALTAVWQVAKEANAYKKVLSEFSGLEHRLEFVRELDGVKYYDDSFGTTPDTAIVALKAIGQPKVLILGGHDKGLDNQQLLAEITRPGQVRHVIAIGELGQKLAGGLRRKHFESISEGLETMPEIVADARAHAKPGDAVLLSCGTSSFGLFKDYKDRGNQFKQAVRELV
jgi:UDP-N-acetylmuramoylalanine--D-glutamate ligase